MKRIKESLLELDNEDDIDQYLLPQSDASVAPADLHSAAMEDQALPTAIPKRVKKYLQDPMLASNKWNLTYKKYPTNQIELIFDFTQSAPQLNHLYLHWNDVESILAIVSATDMRNLRLLNIGGNNISSIESIASLQAPCLEELFMWSNKITTIAPLKKLATQSLRFVDMSSNLIAEALEFRQVSCLNIERVNINSNRFANLNDFIPVLSQNRKIKIVLNDNPLVKIANLPVLKKKKEAQSFILQNKLITYF